MTLGIEAVEGLAQSSSLLPSILLAESRQAARRGETLQLMIRRYFAGYSVLDDFLIEEVELDSTVSRKVLRQLLDGQARFLDRVVATVSEEYSRESEAHPRSARDRRAHLVDRLVAGELLDTSPLGYNFNNYHLALIISGRGASGIVERITEPLDAISLVVPRDDLTIWAWLGSRRPIEPSSLSVELSEIALGIGEPCAGREGWRLTHLQARAAFAFTRLDRDGWTRYRDIGLLAAVQNDDLLVGSLHRIYLAPLARQGKFGERLRETLGAYFDSACNVSSTAALLGVDRRTVTNRLRAVEQLIGQSIQACATDLRLALRSAELGRHLEAGSLDAPIRDL